MTSKDEFVNAIHSMNMVRLTFYSKEDGHNLTRKCAPMDYGTIKGAKDGFSRFHFQDYESDTRKKHPLLLLEKHIVSMVVLDERFDPADFVDLRKWTPNWHITRDWGRFS